MKEIVTQIHIQASPRRIWETLTDFAHFPEWNPFIIRAVGDISPGARLRISFRTHDGQIVNLEPRITSVEPRKELRWVGDFMAPSLLRGEHIFEMFPTPEGAGFIQREKWTGILSMLLQYDGGNRYAFERMNRALKDRVEGVVEGTTRLAA